MQNISSFLDSFFEQIAQAELDIAGLILDHVAYQANSSQDYEMFLSEFSQLGELVSEEIIGDRRVAVFKLFKPIQYQHYSIPALELVEPKAGQVCESAFQHAELVTDKSFDDLIIEYPQIDWDTSSMNRAEFPHLKLNFENGMTLKFINVPILEVVTKTK